MKTFLGSRLKKAREEANLSQGAFARAVGLSSEYISLLESGKRIPSFATLQRIVSALNKDAAYFLSVKEPGFKALFEDPAVPSGLRRELVRFKGWADAYLAAEEATGRRLGLAPKYSHISAERMAEEERKRLGLGDEPIRDIFQLVEVNGLRLMRRPLPEAVRVAGVFVFDEPRAAAFGLVNSAEPPGIEVLAAAHLYGHYLRDRDALMIVDNSDVVLEEYVSLYPPREQFAQQFAAHFLVPPAKLRSLLEKNSSPRGLSFDDVLFLKRFFGVSTRTVLRSLRRHGLLGDFRFEEYFKRDPEEREAALFGDATGVEETAGRRRRSRRRTFLSDRYRLVTTEARAMGAAGPARTEPGPEAQGGE